MIGQVTIAIALLRFNDPGRYVTPINIFRFMDHFLYRFATFIETMEKIDRSEAWTFYKVNFRLRSF